MGHTEKDLTNVLPATSRATKKMPDPAAIVQPGVRRKAGKSTPNKDNLKLVTEDFLRSITPRDAVELSTPQALQWDFFDITPLVQEDRGDIHRMGRVVVDKPTFIACIRTTRQGRIAAKPSQRLGVVFYDGIIALREGEKRINTILPQGSRRYTAFEASVEPWGNSEREALVRYVKKLDPSL
jgi:hypothetical protein